MTPGENWLRERALVEMAERRIQTILSQLCFDLKNDVGDVYVGDCPKCEVRISMNPKD